MRKTSARLNGVTGPKVFTALWKAYRGVLGRSEESKRKIGLCDSDFRVLELLMQKGSQPVNVLGAQIDLTTGSITTAIDRLEAKWLAARKLDPKDRRVRIVELTAKGRRVIERASIEHARDMEKAFRKLSCDERLMLVELLERITSDPFST